MKHQDDEEIHDCVIDDNGEIISESLGLDPYEMNVTTAFSESTLYKFVHMVDIETKVAQKIEQVKDLFSIGDDAAYILMKGYYWNLDKLQQEYFEDDIKIKKDFGIIPATITKPIKPTMCNICFQKLEKTDALICGHLFCTSCWVECCKTALEPGKDSTIVKCPHLDCNVIIPRSFFRKYLPDSLFTKYEKVFCKSFTDGNKALRWCPFPNCDYAVENPSLVSVEVHCKCGKTFCFSCGFPSHLPASCDLVKKWTIKTNSDKENMAWILLHTKPCPKCSKPIEKNQGCNHMTCCQCKYEFCWVCTDSWSLHNYQTGGYYKCNRYELPDEQNEKKTKKAKNDLIKYRFYYERYNNHNRAEDIANIQAEKMGQSIKKLNQKCSYPLNELEFLQNAANSMVEIRRVLKYSYMYGYYLDDQKVKELYEHLQGRLEENAEHLHQLLERNLDYFCTSEIPVKTNKANFKKYKEELSNYYMVTQKVS